MLIYKRSIKRCFNISSALSPINRYRQVYTIHRIIRVHASPLKCMHFVLSEGKKHAQDFDLYKWMLYIHILLFRRMRFRAIDACEWVSNLSCLRETGNKCIPSKQTVLKPRALIRGCHACWKPVVGIPACKTHTTPNALEPGEFPYLNVTASLCSTAIELIPNHAWPVVEMISLQGTCMLRGDSTCTHPLSLGLNALKSQLNFLDLNFFSISFWWI